MCSSAGCLELSPYVWCNWRRRVRRIASDADGVAHVQGPGLCPAGGERRRRVRGRGRAGVDLRVALDRLARADAEVVVEGGRELKTSLRPGGAPAGGGARVRGTWAVSAPRRGGGSWTGRPPTARCPTAGSCSRTPQLVGLPRARRDGETTDGAADGDAGRAPPPRRRRRGPSHSPGCCALPRRRGRRAPGEAQRADAAPVLRGLLDELKRCPLVLSERAPRRRRADAPVARALPRPGARGRARRRARTTPSRRAPPPPGRRSPFLWRGTRTRGTTHETAPRRACRRGGRLGSRSSDVGPPLRTPQTARGAEARLGRGAALVLLRPAAAAPADGAPRRPAAFDAFPRRCSAPRSASARSRRRRRSSAASWSSGQETGDSTSLQRVFPRNDSKGKSIHASSSPRETIARPRLGGKRSRYEAFPKVVSPLSCPGGAHGQD